MLGTIPKGCELSGGVAFGEADRDLGACEEHGYRVAVDYTQDAPATVWPNRDVHREKRKSSVTCLARFMRLPCES